MIAPATGSDRLAAHPILFRLQFRQKFLALMNQLVAQGIFFFQITRNLGQLAAQGDFAPGNFRGIAGIQFGQLFFLAAVSRTVGAALFNRSIASS